MVGSQLNFGLLQTGDNLQTSDYRSAGSHQSENLNYEFTTDNNVWEEIVVVPAGKTYYVSGIILNTPTGSNGTVDIGTGGSGSEVISIVIGLDVTRPVFFAFPTPIKFSSGTRISVRSHVGDEDVHTTLIGWEE